MLSPTIEISHSDPSHLPLSYPAFFMYSAASSGSPFGLARKSRPNPSSPPDSSNPGNPGEM